MNAPTSRTRLEKTLFRLENELKELDRAWNRVPYLLSGVLLAIPLGIIWGAPAAWFAILMTLVTAATSAYIIKVRRQEWRLRIEEARKTVKAAELNAPN